MDPQKPQFKPVLCIADMSFGAGPGLARQTAAPSPPSADGVPAPPEREGADKRRRTTRLALRA